MRSGFRRIGSSRCGMVGVGVGGVALGVIAVTGPAGACGGSADVGGHYYNWTGQIGFHGSWDGTAVWISYPNSWEVNDYSTEHVGDWTGLVDEMPNGLCSNYGACWLQAGVQAGANGAGGVDLTQKVYVEANPPDLPYEFYHPPVGTAQNMEFKISYDGANDANGYPDFDAYVYVSSLQDVFTDSLAYEYQHIQTLSEAMSNNSTGTTFPNCDIIATSGVPEYFGTNGSGNVGSNNMLLEGQGVSWTTWTSSVETLASVSNPGPYSTSYINNDKYYAMRTEGP
jgi:hypothetical protein